MADVGFPASVFLGLGLLAKGPTTSIFYGIVIAVLACWRRMAVLVHPAILLRSSS